MNDKEIREAFEEKQPEAKSYEYDYVENAYYDLDGIFKDFDDDYAIILTRELTIFKSGYTTAMEKAEKQIEELETTIKYLEGTKSPVVKDKS